MEMIKVDSTSTLKLVTDKFMKRNKGRNLIAIIAIVMTTVMFTSLFTAVTSVVKSKEQQDIRNAMDSSHISIQDMTKEQYEKIKNDKHCKKMVRILICVFLQQGHFLKKKMRLP